MESTDSFEQQVRSNIDGLRNDLDLQALSRLWIREVATHKWAYNFSWLGRPAIQFPNDAWAVQELVWATRPDFIIETGIAHGGSLILSASLLTLLDYCDAVQMGTILDPTKPTRKVLGIDIDIRKHNRKAVEAHPMSSRIEMIEGSSIESNTISKVYDRVASLPKDSRILVCLDSNHTHEHVLAELEAYAPLVSAGSYCVVFDTLIEDMPRGSFPDRPWDKGNNPKTAVWEYLRAHPDFEIDKDIQHKLQITVAPDGFIRRIST